MKSGMNSKNQTCWMLLALLFLSVRSIRGAPATSQNWRLNEVVKSTLATHPTLDLQREKLSESEANRGRAGAAIFPTIHSTLLVATKQDALSSSSAAFGGDAYNSYSLGLELNQPIYAGGAVSAGKRVYDKEIEQRKLDVQVVSRDLTLRAMSAFYQVLLAERKMSTQQRLQSIQNELLKTAQARYRIGNEQALTVLQIKTNLSLLEPQVTAAQNQLRVSAAELASLTGNPRILSLKLRGSLEAPDWEEVVQQLPKETHDRLELDQSLVAEDQAAANKDLKMASHLPSLSAIVTWGRNGTQKSDLFDNDASAWSVGLKLNLPLFSGLSSKYDRRVYSSAIAQTKIAERARRDQFALDQVRAEQELANAKSQVASSSRALTQAKEAVEVAGRTYRLGTATYTQVSDSQRNLTNAEISFEQAQFDLIVKMANYFVAFAWPLDSLVASLESKWDRDVTASPGVNQKSR